MNVSMANDGIHSIRLFVTTICTNVRLASFESFSHVDEVSLVMSRLS